MKRITLGRHSGHEDSKPGPFITKVKKGDLVFINNIQKKSKFAEKYSRTFSILEVVKVNVQDDEPLKALCREMDERVREHSSDDDIIKYRWGTHSVVKGHEVKIICKGLSLEDRNLRGTDGYPQGHFGIIHAYVNGKENEKRKKILEIAASFNSSSHGTKRTFESAFPPNGDVASALASPV